MGSVNNERKKYKREWVREQKRVKAWRKRRAAIIAATNRITHRYEARP